MVLSPVWSSFLGILIVGSLLVVPTAGLRFALDKTECFTEVNLVYGDTITGSFVVIDVADDRWDGYVTFEVIDSLGNKIYSVPSHPEDQFHLTVQRSGKHQFCFKNEASHPQTVSFELHTGHHAASHDVVKDEHFTHSEEAVDRLLTRIWEIQYEQQWLNDHNERYEKINKSVHRRVLYKALVQAAVIVGVSVLQVYLLQRLFEKKLRHSRV